MSAETGYRPQPLGGVTVRTDIVDVYVFRAIATGDGRAPLVVESEETGEASQVHGVEFLQLHRIGDPLAGTWQPVMGHIEAGESAVQAAVREMEEELGLTAESGLVALWALEQVHPFYIAAIDSIVLSPRLVAQVSAAWTPRLNEEHSEFRWVSWSEVWRRFMWPGQIAACGEIVEHLLRPGSLAREALRISQIPPRPRAAPDAARTSGGGGNGVHPLTI
ncbi:MAG: NUDIX domain-containing protein [Phycisphaeraceae bacterium]|nr:NUDIX domain-containing protein [Phycisphaeraceae bacterium]